MTDTTQAATRAAPGTIDLKDLGTVHRLGFGAMRIVGEGVPAEEQFGTLRELQDEGKVTALGLSEVGVEQLRAAEQHFTVSTVQNRYNLTDRTAQDVLDHAGAHGIGFIPWAPIAAGELARPGGPVDRAARRLGATPSPVALAWLLRHSPVIMPIPGTASVAHLEENMGAARIELDDATYAELTAAA